MRELYKFAIKPTVAFYFRAPLDVAIDRIVSARPTFKFYEAGMDMDWADDEEESFKIFQGKILDEYDLMTHEFGLTQIDATQPIRHPTASDARDCGPLSEREAQRKGGGGKMKEMKFYGSALPGIDVEPYAGKLIVIEGTDGVGRSTHVAILRTWLESAGYAVLDTGMTRSVLAGRGIKNARTGHTLGRLTLQLYYATDFADRLQNQILPALRAGFVVLTDRYIYSAIARAVVRGADPEWVRRHLRHRLSPRCGVLPAHANC